jgi:hypothetical protein
MTILVPAFDLGKPKKLSSFTRDRLNEPIPEVDVLQSLQSETVQRIRPLQR